MRRRAISRSRLDPRSPFALLAQDALVSDPQGDAFLVEPLGERDGELPALPGQLLETLRVDRPVGAEVGYELAARLVQGLRSEPQLFAHLARPACRRERLEQRRGPVRRF